MIAPCRSYSWVLACFVAVGCDRDLVQPVAEFRSNNSGSNPSAPSSTNAVAVSHDQIDISWRDNSSNETGFELHRSSTGPSGAYSLLASTGANASSYSHAGLNASTQYCYKVRAFRTANGKASYSSFSNTACATTQAPPVLVPAAASNVSAAPVNVGRAIGISWTDAAGNESGFRIERSATSTGPWMTLWTIEPNMVGFIDLGPPAADQPACYRVFAFNSYGDSPGSNVDCTAVPAAASSLVATVTGSDVDLTWTDNSGVEDGFQVLRGRTKLSTVVVATLPANATGYHDPGLAGGYWYQVLATKDGGTSRISNSASAVIATVLPISPAGTDALPGGSSVAAVTWGDTPTNEAGFRVERSTDGGASWVVAGRAGIDEIWFYDVEQPSEQQLCYRVIAFNSQGDSPPSNTDCTTLPAAPDTPLVTRIEGPAFELTWTDNSGIEDGYEVQRLFCDWDMCHDWEPIATLGPNTTNYRDLALWQFAYGYYYRVFALKEGGRSDPSGEAFVMMTP